MTPEALAAFISSPRGKLYERVCQHYGRAPGDAVDDDVLAFSMNLGFYSRALLDKPGAPEGVPADATIVTDLEQRLAADMAMRQAG